MVILVWLISSDNSGHENAKDVVNCNNIVESDNESALANYATDSEFNYATADQHLGPSELCALRQKIWSENKEQVISKHMDLATATGWLFPPFSPILLFNKHYKITIH